MFADNADNTAEFLDDLARSPTSWPTRPTTSSASPTPATTRSRSLNDHEAELVTILQQTGRLSNDVADLLARQQAVRRRRARRRAATPSSSCTTSRNQVDPARRSACASTSRPSPRSIRIPVGDGTLMGAVKGVLGGQLCALIPCPGGPAATTPPASAAAVRPPPAAHRRRAAARRPDPAPASGDVGDLLRRVLGA